jgi:hypothetical protein
MHGAVHVRKPAAVAVDGTPGVATASTWMVRASAACVVGAAVRFAVVGLNTAEMVSFAGMPAPAVICAPTSAAVNVPTVSVTSGLVALKLPVGVAATGPAFHLSSTKLAVVPFDWTKATSLPSEENTGEVVTAAAPVLKAQ